MNKYYNHLIQIESYLQSHNKNTVHDEFSSLINKLLHGYF